MTMKQKAKRMEPREVSRLQERMKSPLGQQIADALCRLLLGAVLSTAEIFQGYTPFGLAFVAASGSGLDGFAALVGAVLGTMLHGGFAEGLRYAAAAVLIFSVSFAFYDVALFARSWFMPVIGMLMNGITGFIYRSATGWTSQRLIFFLTELFLTGAATYYYRVAFGETQAVKGAEHQLRQRISLLLLVATALIALSGVSVHRDVSLGRSLAALLVITAAFTGGFGSGGCVGLVLGLAMDFAAASQGAMPFYTMSFGLAGLMCGLLKDYGKGAAVLGYLVSNGMAVLWAWTAEMKISALYEVMLAAVAFFLVPKSLLAVARELFRRERPEADGRSGQQVQGRLQGTSQIFRSLHQMLKTAADKPESGDRIFDRAAEAACQGCALQQHCWQENYATSRNACNDALPAMLRRGQAATVDFPHYFSSRCVRMPAFLEAVNRELTGLLYRQQYEKRLQESRTILAEQYEGMSVILEDLAAQAEPQRPKGRTAPPLMALSGAASRKRSGEQHCGDAGSCFKTVEGTLYVLLCDGMGCGAAAQEDSGIAVELLERFLQSGIGAEGALQTLATALGLRAETAGGFTTIDLLEVDLFSGKAAIYKYGAAASYLRRNTRVMAVTGESLPAGAGLLRLRAPDTTRFTLGVGDCVLLLSDGLAEAQQEEQLREALRRYRPATEPKAFVADLLSCCHGEDDATAILVYIAERT